MCEPVKPLGALTMLVWIVDLWSLLMATTTFLFVFFVVFGQPERDGWRRTLPKVAGIGAAGFTLTAIVTFGAVAVAAVFR